MKAKLVFEKSITSRTDPAIIKYREDGRPYLPVGTVIDRPDAWHLVVMGAADPADEECRIKCGMSEADIKWKQKLHELDIRGVSSEDKLKFLSGELKFDADGQIVPGDNYVSDTIIT